MADVKISHLNDLMYVYFRDAVDELKEALRNLTEVSVDTGVADATSTVNQLDDIAKAWPVDAFQYLIVEITVGTGAGQVRKINSNTATALLPVTPFATAPDATSEYRIGFYGRMASDITHWGSTLLTGRDVSLDFKALTDDGIKGILKTLGDIGAGDNIATILAAIQTAVEIMDDWDEANRAAVNLIAGQVGVQAGAGGQDALTQRVVAATDSPEVAAIGSASDAAVAAGAIGTMCAKLRAISRDLVANIVLATGANVIGGVTIADGSDATQGAIADAAVAAGAAGSEAAKLRRLTTDLDAVLTAAETIASTVHIEDTVHTTADKGTFVLTVRKDDVDGLSDTDGDYDGLIVNEHGILRSQAQQHREITPLNAITGWTVLGNDTINLATTTNHVFNALALEFDKVDGADNTVFAGIQKTISSLDMAAYHKGGGFFLKSAYMSDITDVDYCFLRLGTDNANYNEWRVSVDNLTNGWNSLRYIMASPSAITGVGWNSAAVTYVAIGVAFLLQNNTLAGIAMDHLAINTGLQVSADIVAEVSSSVATPNVNVLKLGNKVINLQAGAASTGTQRIIAATDSPEVVFIGATDDAAAAAGAVGTLSAKLRAISRDLVANIVLATGANAIGKLAANSGVDIGDVNAPVLETLASSVDTTPTQITKTVAAIGTPEALAADETFFRTATIIGKKAPRIDNVGIVYLGIGAGNDTQPYEITPGETIELSAPPGEKYDLNDWYCDVLNAGDGVIIIYS